MEAALAAAGRELDVDAAATLVAAARAYATDAAGSYGAPGRLQDALAAGATGIQVGDIRYFVNLPTGASPPTDSGTITFVHESSLSTAALSGRARRVGLRPSSQATRELGSVESTLTGPVKPSRPGARSSLPNC